MYRVFNYVLFSSLFLLIGCGKKTIRTDRLNVPNTISIEEWRKESVTVKESQPLSVPGKIYRKGSYLYVNEVNKGIHVYDNSNPSAPLEISFVDLLLNTELAIYGDVMYVNSYTDLILLDVSNPNSIHEIHRLKDVFDIHFSDVSNGYDYNFPREYIDFSTAVIKGWKVEEVEREVVDDNSRLEYFNPSTWGGNELTTFSTTSGTFNSVSSGGGSGAGVGGSMAKFTIAGQNLFMLKDQVILCYDISNPKDPQFVGDENTNRTAQTLFPRGDQLFVGTTSGMLIYQVSNNGSINLISTFEHFTSCDPVVVDGDKAYVTLSSGCRNTANQLDVIDISDITNPTLIKTYAFTHPLGLGVDNNTLFLCDDQDGLKVFDVTDPLKVDVNQLAHFSNMNAFDVIPYQDLLILVGDDGIAQYDYSNVQQIVQLSSILIQ